MTAKPALIDSFGRRIEYLRVSVTDRCNYRCFYCMPRAGVQFENAASLLDNNELARLIRLFSDLGVRRVRLTGGEPLVRRHLVALAGMISELPGIEDLSLSTNGHLLERYAASLKQTGVQRVNISLDSLDPALFARITHGGDLHAVQRGIDAALAVGMQPVKLNMVVMQGINDHEIESMLDFAVAQGADLRYIETMPVGPQADESRDHHYPAALILERLRRHAGADLIPVGGSIGCGPARYYQVGASPVKLGVISAVSRHFCDDCNRVRLTAQGDLVLCLGRHDRVSLRETMRCGCTDEMLKTMIHAAVMKKPERHDFQNAASGSVVLIPMSALGG
jgi:cyclic pyranopterin phosphate synthase